MTRELFCAYFHKERFTESQLLYRKHRLSTLQDTRVVLIARVDCFSHEIEPQSSLWLISNAFILFIYCITWFYPY